MTTSNDIHVRAGELAAQVAVDLTKGLTSVRTFHSHDDKGFSHRVAVVESLWTTTDVAAPTVVVKLANGQEFELEVRHSSHELRTARLAVEHAAARAERGQDEDNAAARAAKEG